jgi:hypothetical protein
VRSRACIVFLLAVFCAGGIAAHAKMKEDVPGSLKGVQTIGDALKTADQRPVHILYMHGINSLGSDDSRVFRESICSIERLCASEWQNAGTEFPDQGPFALDAPAPDLQYLGVPIWTNDNNAEQWRSSAPFVTHYVVQLRGHNAILVVDEINWWPVVIKLKCQRIVPGDARLAGPNPSLLNFCSLPTKIAPNNPQRFIDYQWMSTQDAAALGHLPNRAVYINRELKTGLEDWGFSDVFLGIGPLRPIMEEGIRQLIAKSAAFDPRSSAGTTSVHKGRQAYNWQEHLANGRSDDQVFIAVTHSMGSFLLLDTLDLDTSARAKITPQPQTPQQSSAETQALQYVAERTSLIYFFANQVPILELANLKNGSSPSAAAASGPDIAVSPQAAPDAGTSETALISQWAQVHAAFEQRLHPDDTSAQTKMEIVAFSDPSDLLTWRVPKLRDVDVVNLYPQNGLHWFWLVESPTAAHDNYASNKSVIRVMFGK